MTAETIHTCSYECERPECIRAQRDELAARMAATPDEIAELVRKAVEAERERCARVCESLGGNGPGYIDDDWARMCAAAIRDSRAQQSEARGVVDEVWMFKGVDGMWRTFLSEQHRLDTIADGRWEVRKFYALPPPAAAQHQEPKP